MPDLQKLMHRQGHRYLLWVAYDGSRFKSIADKSDRHNVLGFIHSLMRNTFLNAQEEIKIAASSRTDVGVHALRNAFIVQIPREQTDMAGDNLLMQFNTISRQCVGPALHFLHFHPVSDGFCARRNISYRKYKYRLAVAESDVTWQRMQTEPSLCHFAERPYIWFLPNGFDPIKAQNACNMFLGTQNMASFMKYSKCASKEHDGCIPTLRHIFQVSLSSGTSRFKDCDGFELYDITIISRSFLRSQIRHMMRAIVEHAYGHLAMESIRWLLEHPSPSNFHGCGLVAAPPQGLFLEDVVYDERMFTNPVPFHHHSWDDKIHD